MSGASSINNLDSGFLAFLGRLSFVFMALTIVYASFSPPQMIPHILYSYHLEHFAIFYFLGIATSSAFVRRDVFHLGLAIWVAALFIEAIRWVSPIHRDFAIVDWVADAAGAAAALVPIRIGHFRNGFGPMA